MNTSPVTLAELACATEDLPLETPAAPTSCGASLAMRAPAPLEPTAADIATLTAQYRKAVNGLYEAYVFGQMLMAVKSRLEAPSPGDATRGTARCEQDHGGALAEPGWNAGTGLKTWLAEHCPEINYSTARRFLSVAEKTNAALALQAQDGATGMSLPHAGGGDGLVMSAEGAPSSLSSFSPSEEAVKAFLEGKSQRQIIGGKRAGAGRPRKDWEAALGQSPEAAFKRLEEALAPLNELVVVKRTHRMLSEVDLETVRAAIDLLHERIHEEA